MIWKMIIQEKIGSKTTETTYQIPLRIQTRFIPTEP
jgi:hypothetical protein